MTKLSLIVAMDQKRLIGRDNQLPWHLPADLRYFKATTLGKPVVMGRKTFESIGKPLPGRRNIVISRNTEFTAPGCDIVSSIDEALAQCSAEAEVMLIGGASLYAQTLERADCLYITRIHHEFDGDTWFPEFDLARWQVEKQDDFDPDHDNPYPYSFIKFKRVF